MHHNSSSQDHTYFRMFYQPLLRYIETGIGRLSKIILVGTVLRFKQVVQKELPFLFSWPTLGTQVCLGL
ncbi:hypothetical protein BDW68DRAFT_152940 [Aspergillus falconensis]